jgi:uncharacterized membrane protein YhaH (DUF805 family)
MPPTEAPNPILGRQERSCPACGETILAVANKCKHCGTWLSEGSPAANPGGADPGSSGAVPEMSFGDAVRACLSKYADFNGRARRAEYWYWQLFVILVNLVAAFVVTILFGTDAANTTSGLVMCALLLPGLAVIARRLHDTGRSGWWWFIAFSIVGVIPLLIWICQEGTKGSNEYGPRTT